MQVLEARMSQKNDNREVFQHLKERIASRLDPTTTDDIVKIIVEECGGLRISFPKMRDLWREQRNRLIQRKFEALACEVGPQEAYKQIAANNDLSVLQVRRIVHGTCGRKREDD